jgi:hypothetical protein
MSLGSVAPLLEVSHIVQILQLIPRLKQIEILSVLCWNLAYF